jgi:OHCU decarboxylase
MTLAELNVVDPTRAEVALLQCCGSRNWSQAMLNRRPFSDRDSLLSTAESLWWTLAPADWLEAFAAHPKLGAKRLSAWSAAEQNGVAAAPPSLLQELAERNNEYEKQFGYIFLLNATGKSAEDMLASLTARLANDPPAELRIAAAEQAAILRLRLTKLLDS